MNEDWGNNWLLPMKPPKRLHVSLSDRKAEGECDDVQRRKVFTRWHYVATATWQLTTGDEGYMGGGQEKRGNVVTGSCFHGSTFSIMSRKSGRKHIIYSLNRHQIPMRTLMRPEITCCGRIHVSFYISLLLSSSLDFDSDRQTVKKIPFQSFTTIIIMTINCVNRVSREEMRVPFAPFYLTHTCIWADVQSPWVWSSQIVNSLTEW